MVITLGVIVFYLSTTTQNVFCIRPCSLSQGSIFSCDCSELIGFSCSMSLVYKMRVTAHFWTTKLYLKISENLCFTTKRYEIIEIYEFHIFGNKSIKVWLTLSKILWFRKCVVTLILNSTDIYLHPENQSTLWMQSNSNKN